MAGFLGFLKFVKGPVQWGGAQTMDGALSVAGASAVAAVAASGRVTTTDGVASGAARVVGGRHSVAVAAGTSLTGTVSETVLASATLVAGALKAGTVLKCRFRARVTADTGATTLTVRLRLGATTLLGSALVTTAAVDTGSGDLCMGEFVLTARAAPGATSACVGFGAFIDPAVGGTYKTANLNSTNFATNGALLLELTGEWSAADANAVQAEEFYVEIVG